MPSLEIVKTSIDYHVDMTRRVWDSIGRITDEQFVTDDAYSRGSIRNLMVHLASTDRRWLAGLKNQPDVGHLKFEDFPTRAAARETFENIAKELAEYAHALNGYELVENAHEMPSPRWTILLHLVNHGTDHRATVLQRLTELGAPSFDQDFITWFWRK
ncbi:MAG TPA: DinB family protein [Anaerolineales bacterium]|jgi:uncharacterized damage-inducible protein DinB|nr:DinB family protein [Anaerolineales bacterium]